MSFNGSGTFLINSSGQPVVTNTVISSTAFNALTADLGTGLSTTITKDGQTTATAKIPFAQGLSAAAASNFAAGTVAAPGLYLATDTGTGLYRIAANNYGVAVSGAKVLDISSTGLSVTGALSVGASSVALVTYTRQVFLSGSAATYTTPAGCKRIVVRAKGGGGGGSGSADGTANATSGGAGGDSIFNSVNAKGGSGGAHGTMSSGSGGVGGLGGTGGTGTASVRIAGQSGFYPIAMYVSATNAEYWGGNGGGQGGARVPAGTATGGVAIANSGGGGSGAIGPAASFATIYTYDAPGGGGEGEYIEIIISSPAATYTYTVGAAGAAGAAGTNGFAGGAGGSGYIIVDEYY